MPNPGPYCHSQCPTHRTWCALHRDHGNLHIGGFAGCDCTWEIGYQYDTVLTLPDM